MNGMNVVCLQGEVLRVPSGQCCPACVPNGSELHQWCGTFDIVWSMTFLGSCGYNGETYKVGVIHSAKTNR